MVARRGGNTVNKQSQLATQHLFPDQWQENVVRINWPQAGFVFFARDGVIFARDGLKFIGVTLELFWKQKMFRGSPVKFFVKDVVSGNAVQIFSNFPAKRLDI